VNAFPASIGLDLGGTSYTTAWLEGKTLRDVTEHATRAFRPRDEIVADLAASLLETKRSANQAGVDISSAAVGFPGVIDARRGVVILPPNFGEGWVNFPLADALETRTGMRVRLVNDARAFTLAEARLGAAAGATDALGITIGTGVGGGLILDGRLFLGRFCTAGEFGHQLYDPHGPTCGCGSPGCIEVHASGPAIVASAVRPLRQGRVPILRELIGGNLEHLDPRAIAAAASAGESECMEILTRAAHALAWGIANLVHVIGFEVVVIGGGIAGAGELLFDPIREYLQKNARMIPHLPRVVGASLGVNAGVIGACLWAREITSLES
jgi:glucokinase